jgi:hypothetical protein
MCAGGVVSTELDNFAKVHSFLQKLAAVTGEWAGIPVPIEGESLVIERTYPFAAILNPPVDSSPPTIKVRNCFWSMHRRSEIVVWQEGSKVEWGLIPGVHHLDQSLRTLGASVAWTLEQESRALSLLREHLNDYAFTRYLLTGSFLERSKRSGVYYLFRRLRPTVAMADNGERMRILAALCLHPIAYYAGSWAGAMCPTDDVLAHLMLMRGDEHLLWRRANQHPAFRPEAGI